MSAQGQKVLEIARRWIGTPYRHQASVRGAGADCLGLLRGIWREVHGAEPEQVPPYTADWSEVRGDEALHAAALRHLRPVAGSVAGAVILFRMRDGAVAKHLGIDSGAQSFVHAYTSHGVLESPLSTPWERRIVVRFQFPERKS